MKIFLVLALVLAGVWLFRASRKSARQRARPVEKPVTMALDMVRCDHDQCDTHLPKADAIAGKHGLYCSAEHRQQAES
jgi:uncharacterized protein